MASVHNGSRDVNVNIALPFYVHYVSNLYEIMLQLKIKDTAKVYFYSVLRLLNERTLFKKENLYFPMESTGRGFPEPSTLPCTHLVCAGTRSVPYILCHTVVYCTASRNLGTYSYL